MMYIIKIDINYEFMDIKLSTLTISIKFNLLLFYYKIRPDETWMNSFLFNIIIILLSSVALTHFCTYAFSQYVRLSSLDFIFNVQIKNMKFYKYFF